MALQRARVGLKFLDIEDDTILEVKELEGCISINSYNQGEDNNVCIILDVPTAIKLHKTLRTEINKAKGVQDVK
tara:strand:- start:152 stop:373 length:222 start_codon:yes stop_codon:yes gene_type:complete